MTEDLTSLAGQISVVTGAASGIGRASAILLARRGAHVIALGKEATKRLQSLGITPKFSIPHPSWAKRFNKRDEYLQSLSSILQKDNSFRIQLSAAECAIPS